MAHVMKHTKASCGHMFKHYDREEERISNENIDRTRTHLNYNLATHQQMDQGEYVRQRCEEVYCLNRKDVNVMCSWVVTAPKDLPEEAYKAFFEESYEFLEKRYGKENVVSSYVHMDEVTPHMHFAFVPVTYDQKRGCNKVSAKEVINRQELKVFHNALECHLEEKLGFKVNILNEATKEGNKAINELKRGTAQEELQSMQEFHDALFDENAGLLIEKFDLQGDIRRAEERLQELEKLAEQLMLQDDLQEKLERRQKDAEQAKKIKNLEKFKEFACKKYPTLIDEYAAANRKELLQNREQRPFMKL